MKKQRTRQYVHKQQPNLIERRTQHSYQGMLNRRDGGCRLALFAFVFLSLVSLSAPANAQSIGYILCEVWWMIHDDIGRGIATLAIVAVGIGATLGKVSWGMVLLVGVGIGVLFGANDLTFMLTGYRCLAS